MKYLLTILCVFSLISIYSCKSTTEPCPELPEKHPNGVFLAQKDNLITIDTFNVWKARWDANYRAYMASDSLHYFDVPLLDLTTILAENNGGKKIDGSRFYMGMGYDTGSMTPHTMIVGTLNGVSNFNTILDYSRACPKHCGGN